MIIVLGLILLVAAVVFGVAGVVTNTGSAHALGTVFSVFGYHVTGSAGTLFLYGLIVGAVAVLGLALLLAGARRTSRRGAAARHGLKQSRRETAVAGQARDELAGQHDELIGQRDTARAQSAAAAREREDMTVQRDTARAQAPSGRESQADPGDLDQSDDHRARHLFGHRRPVHH